MSQLCSWTLNSLISKERNNFSNLWNLSKMRNTGCVREHLFWSKFRVSFTRVLFNQYGLQSRFLYVWTFLFFCFFLFVIFLTGRKIIFIFLFLEIFYQSFTQNLLFSDESRKSEARSWGTNLICSTEEIRCYSVYLSLWQL